MLNEHTRGRNFVRGALEGIEEFKSGKQGELQSIYENLGNYAILLQNHIDKENNILFPMTDQVFSDEEQRRLLVQFGEVENRAEAEFNHANSIQKINKLVDIYL